MSDPRRFQIKHFFAIVFIWLCSAYPLAYAQTPSPSSGNSSSSAPPGVFSDILGAIDDASRVLVKQIQPGKDRNLVTNPYFDSQESPRHALMSFVEAMKLVERGFVEVGYERAMKSLPDFVSEDQADKLYQTLLRIGPISATDAPGPDRVQMDGDTRFQVFPRAMMHDWVWSQAEPPPDAEIALILDETNTWRFSDRSINKVDELLSSLVMLPPRFSANRQSGYFAQVFTPLFADTSLIDWLFFFVIFLGGFVLALMFSFGMLWVANRDVDRAVAAAVKGLGRAGAVTLTTIAFTIALGFLNLGPVLEPLHYEIPRFLMVIAMTFLLLSIIDVVATLATLKVKRDAYDRMLVTTIYRVLRVCVIALVIFFVLQVIFSVNVGAIFIGFGFIALALSLAAQDTVKNMFGAVSIFMNRPFVVGDWIIFKGRTTELCGVVDDIELQATKITDLSGNLITLPNMQFIDREVQNLSARGFIRRDFEVAIPYRSNADELNRALDALRDVLTSDEVKEDALITHRDNGDPHITFFEFGESWLTLKIYHYYYFGESGERQRETDRGWFTYLDHCSLVNRKVVEIFGERDIEFAFPTQTIELRGSKDTENLPVFTSPTATPSVENKPQPADQQ